MQTHLWAQCNSKGPDQPAHQHQSDQALHSHFVEWRHKQRKAPILFSGIRKKVQTENLFIPWSLQDFSLILLINRKSSVHWNACHKNKSFIYGNIMKTDTKHRKKMTQKYSLYSLHKVWSAKYLVCLGLSLPSKMWLGKLTTLDMFPLGWLGRRTSTQKWSAECPLLGHCRLVHWSAWFSLQIVPNPKQLNHDSHVTRLVKKQDVMAGKF